MTAELVYLAAGIIIGFITAWFIRKYQFNSIRGISFEEAGRLNDQMSDLKNEKGRMEERTTGLERQLTEVKIELLSERKEAQSLKSSLVAATTEHANLQDKLTTQKSELEQIQQKFTVEFENLANKILDEKSRKFTEQNRVNLDGILKPLNDKIGEFRDKVEKAYVDESRERLSLEKEIKRLADLNVQMSKDANNLTSALKGDSKTQGNWGEMILESILEKSGLEKGREFIVQESHGTDDGGRVRPDVVINLPEKRNMIIDSKVSLKAYEQYNAAVSEDDRSSLLAEHVNSLRSHIKILSQKNYQNLYRVNSPDFVLLFMPIEPALALAINAEPNLFGEAFDKHVVIVSPSTLLATLKTVESIWRLENQNRNAMEIARQAGALYDKFVAFIEDLTEVGKKIDMTQKAYDNAMNKLHTGTGNLVRRVENIKQLGAKTTKGLPQQLVEIADNTTWTE